MSRDFAAYKRSQIKARPALKWWEQADTLIGRWT